MEKFISYLSQDSNRLIYLSFFRIYIAFHLMKKILLQWTSMDTLYGVNSFAVREEPFLARFIDMKILQYNYKILLFVYMIVIVLFAFGIGKYYMTILLFFFFQLFQRMNQAVINGGDNLLTFLLLYMIFCNCYEYFSYSKFKFKSNYTRKFSNVLTNLGVFSIMLHLSLIYFTTGLHKAHSEVWFNGVATYYTLSLDRYAGTKYNWDLVKNGYFVTFSTYFTLLWELSFPFVVWYKKIRPYVLICGVFLHLGIYIFMMIHDFEILFIMIYGFFFTDDQIRTFIRKIVKLKIFQPMLKINFVSRLDSKL